MGYLSSVAAKRTVLFILLMTALCGVYTILLPDIRPVLGADETAAIPLPRQFILPFWYQIERTTVMLSIEIDNSPVYPTYYELFADDCVEHLAANGILLNEKEPLFCDHRYGRTYDLSSLLRPGKNYLQVRLRNGLARGDFHMRVSRLDPWFLGIYSLVIIVTATYVAGLLQSAAFSRNVRTLLYVLLAGASVRYLYMLATPFGVRSHDVTAHLEYVKFLDELWALPPYWLGWTLHHPPLYYLVSLLWMKTGAFFGLHSDHLIYFLQILSLLLSIGALGAAILIVPLLFPEEERIRERGLLAALFAFFPGLIFFSARISNDALFQLLAFLVLLFAFRWWVQPSRRTWFVLQLLCGFALLTKATALLFIAWSYMLLLLKEGIGLSRKGVMFLESVAVILCVAGWYIYARVVTQGQRLIDPTFFDSHANLKMKTRLLDFFVFNPLQILEKTYNNPWSDDARRSFFWEYSYRSAFLGEFDFGPSMLWISTLLLLLGMLLAPVMILGMRRAAYRGSGVGLPLLLLLLLSLGSLISLRLGYPASSAQDFRFIFYAAVPCGYFLVRGFSALRGSYRTVVLSWFYGVVAASALFFVMIFFLPTPNRFEPEELSIYRSWKKQLRAIEAAGAQGETGAKELGKRSRKSLIRLPKS